jgi:hypothetical protein
MRSLSTTRDFSQPAIKSSCALFDDGWFDPIELSVRGQVRVFIEEMIQNELVAAIWPSQPALNEIARLSLPDAAFYYPVLVAK